MPLEKKLRISIAAVEAIAEAGVVHDPWKPHPGSRTIELVKASELRRKLAKAGCTFEDATRHTIVRYKGNSTLLPRHPGQEIKKGLYHGVLKRLGLKESEV